MGKIQIKQLLVDFNKISTCENWKRVKGAREALKARPNASKFSRQLNWLSLLQQNEPRRQQPPYDDTMICVCRVRVDDGGINGKRSFG